MGVFIFPAGRMKRMLSVLLSGVPRDHMVEPQLGDGLLDIFGGDLDQRIVSSPNISTQEDCAIWYPLKLFVNLLRRR